MSDLTATVDLLGELVAYPTISTDPNRAIIDLLAGRLTAAGAQVEVMGDSHKANLWATLGPDEAGGVLLSGHTDVVPVADQDWTGDPFVMREDQGRLYGRGTCDMKGFVAAATVLANTLRGRTLTRPLHFAFTHDEETGCLGAQALIEVLRTRPNLPSVAIIGEPTSMQVIDAHKGCFEYRTRFTGAEGHGSAPDLGVNAAEYAARYVARLLGLRELMKTRAPSDSPFDPPWTTINVGSIHSGVAPNVIPGKAEVEWEMRPVRDEDADFVKSDLSVFESETLLPAMRSVSAIARIETDILGEVVGLSRMEVNAARELICGLTGANDAGSVAFGTEAGLFQSLGMSAVICGPGSIEQAHKPDEWIALDQLSECCAMLEKLGKTLTAV